MGRSCGPASRCCDKHPPAPSLGVLVVAASLAGPVAAWAVWPRVRLIRMAYAIHLHLSTGVLH